MACRKNNGIFWVIEMDGIFIFVFVLFRLLLLIWWSLADILLFQVVNLNGEMFSLFQFNKLYVEFRILYYFNDVGMLDIFVMLFSEIPKS